MGPTTGQRPWTSHGVPHVPWTCVSPHLLAILAKQRTGHFVLSEVVLFSAEAVRYLEKCPGSFILEVPNF